ncbi:MAG: IS6 family transposase [Euryarchaeota archaeon]|nr:IS6 family transposase [Euryarchaeota archaeon]MDE1837677.1 IS6 family transposase [Euryarchaeota archaeon]MDE1880352.1 IS6 family transposase [Euryarchaeota archaeon]MDE2046339.1 IS6 family transposase [Thermoplasmata archaeon]
MTEFTETITHERTVACRVCGSTDLVKDGFGAEDSQFFLCRSCRRKSTGSDGFPRMQYDRDAVVRALTYYYNGMSYKHVGTALKTEDRAEVPKWTAWRWVVKYSKLVNDYTVTLPADTGPVWMADETAVFIFGKQYWFWDCVDTKTRFLLASHLSRVRDLTDATKFFRMARWRSKTKPKVLLTDKLPAYYRAFNKVFYSPYPEMASEHLTSSGFNSPTNINLLERFHGTFKARVKVMKGLKVRECARVVLDGFVTWYNFLTPHESLGGRTPAMAAGIAKGPLDWKTLIELALKAPKKNPEVPLEWREKFGIE